MATSPEAAPSQSNGTEANPASSSISLSEALSALNPSTNSSLLAVTSPAPEASSPPPPETTPATPPASPPPSPPPASPPPASPSPPPPADSSLPPDETTPSPPPPEESQSPPPPPDSSSSPTPPTSSPPPPTTTSPPTPGSPPAPVFSPPPPGTSDSQSPPSPALSHSPPLPRTNRSSGSSLPGPSTSTATTTTTPPPSDSISIKSGVIVGVVVGGAVIIALLIVCLIWSRRKKKPKYYIDGVRPAPQGSDQYYYATQPFSPQPMEHMVKVPPPPGTMGTPGWGAPPTPPPANISSDFSTSHSGPHPTPAHLPTPMHLPSPNMGGIGAKSQFTYEELAIATSGFSQENLLGQGGFGFVHKGILPDGREVAVKSLKSGSGQGEREFQAEVEIISRVHHRHLVSLVGYCIADGQRMLVYEFVPNKTLEFHLHGKGQPIMDWSTRLLIALGSAKGLAYLHEDCHPRIIHRDIKAANILLDFNFEAMVADFGLAKLTSDNNTHVSTRVMGTFGYLAPEYASSGKLTEKSDVFSFGVMLLELITGRRPVDLTNKIMEDSLVDWARPLLTKALEDGNYDELVDPLLEGNYIPHELARMVACAAASIRHSARRRPKMSQVVRALDGVSSLEDLNDGVKPGQSGPNGNSDAYDTRAYDADMVKFRKMVMSSQEFNSSEFGGTSEYGLNPSSSSSDSREMERTPDLRNH